MNPLEKIKLPRDVYEEKQIKRKMRRDGAWKERR